MLALILGGLLLLELAGWTWLGHNLFHSGHGWLTVIGVPLALAIVWRALLVVAGFALSGVWRAARGGSWRQRWSAWGGEFWWQLKLYAFVHPLLGFEFGRRAAERQSGPVVVLVHGFLCNAGMWRGFARRLATEGIHRTYAVNLDPRYLDMQRSLTLLDQKLDRILASEGEADAVLIGHSMGGVLVRMYRQRWPGKVRAAICLGAPHHGTLGARLVGAGRERGPPSPTSRWLTAYNTEHPLESGLLNIWSTSDNIVWPQHHAQLAGADELKLAGYGHLHLLAAPALLEAVVACIRRSGEPAPVEPVA